MCDTPPPHPRPLAECGVQAAPPLPRAPLTPTPSHRHCPLKRHQAHKARSLPGAVQQAPRPQRPYKRADETADSALVPGKNGDGSLGVLLPHLEKLRPPLLGVDQEEPLPLGSSLSLEGELGRYHLLPHHPLTPHTLTLPALGKQLQSEVENASRDARLGAHPAELDTSRQPSRLRRQHWAPDQVVGADESAVSVGVSTRHHQVYRLRYRQGIGVRHHSVRV